MSDFSDSEIVRLKLISICAPPKLAPVLANRAENIRNVFKVLMVLTGLVLVLMETIRMSTGM